MLEKKNAALDIILDDDFKGIMYGLPEESAGCKLKGKVVLNNRHSISTKKLVFFFTGRITVACGPPMYSSMPEYSETQTLIRKEILFHNSVTSHKKIPCGIHEYYFDFELPGYLPSSFKGTRGRIEYFCNAVLTRPTFRSDINVKKTVQIKRCLMNETQTLQAHNATFSEGLLDEKIRYQISTPIMTFHDGGLIQTELKLKTLDSNIVVESVEYGFKEHIQYQTTGEHINSIIATVDESRYPLGEERVEIDTNNNDTFPIGINVRLCPWVNCDINSELITIEHKLSITVWISERTKIEDEDFPGRDTDRRNSARLSFPIPGLSRDRREGRVTSLPPTKIHAKRSSSSRTFSLSTVVNSMNAQRALQLTKVEKKSLRFEIPIIVTSKSARQRTSPPYTQVDRPPAYAIATMLPPPPVYAGASANDLIIRENNFSNEYLIHDFNDLDLIDDDDDDDDDDL